LLRITADARTVLKAIVTTVIVNALGIRWTDEVVAAACDALPVHLGIARATGAILKTVVAFKIGNALRVFWANEIVGTATLWDTFAVHYDVSGIADAVVGNAFGVGWTHIAVGAHW
jgi:hypothetical protein